MSDLWTKLEDIRSAYHLWLVILFLIGAVLWLCLKPLVLLDELRQKRARKKTGIRIGQLERLGWKSPTEDTQGNYWRQWSLEDTDTLESIGKHILRVFREVCHADPNELVQLDLTL